MKNVVSNKKIRSHLVLYLFGFLLLWEWLRPLKVLTDTGNISLFVLFIILSWLILYVRLPFLYSFLIKTVFILFVVHLYYFEGPIIQWEWFLQFIQDLSLNIHYVFEAKWNLLSGSFRSLLFFLLLWLLTYLIQYWLVIRRQIFLFFLMTLLYITILDTFTPYNADWAIVRTVISGFAMMGMLHYDRLLDREVISNSVKNSRNWMVPLAIMIAFCVAIGFAAPKFAPIWPDPVPFITSFNQDSGDGMGGGQRVGYGTDDSSLGGPFIGDDHVVFTAEADFQHYWKIESKYIYTGKGWVEEGRKDNVLFAQNEQVPMEVFDKEGVKTTKETSTVTLTDRSQPFVDYPLGVTKINGIEKSKTAFNVNTLTEKILFVDDEQSLPINKYMVEFERPQYSMKALSQSVDPNTMIDRNFYKKYTQLPPRLPSRVKQLAVEITSKKKTWFDKAKAVEGYFASNGFIYDQKNVAKPAEDQDYVDQFLFESKQGYCDNFSSSMAILLRTIGIPTRWVKGYTQGEYKGIGEQQQNRYVITNNNAHSWVEVYFPKVGWIPFEPTQGFSNNVAFNYDLENQSDSQTNLEQDKETTQLKKPEKQVEKSDRETKDFSLADNWKKIKRFFATNVKIIIGLTVFLFGSLLYLYSIRKKWIPVLLNLKWKRSNRDRDFVKAYNALLKQLNRAGLKRKPEQTLRDYANYIDHYFATREMGKLTAAYEEYLYKGVIKEGTWNELKELWENLIKRTKG